jgi:hypothetical protein
MHPTVAAVPAARPPVGPARQGEAQRQLAGGQEVGDVERVVQRAAPDQHADRPRRQRHFTRTVDRGVMPVRHP